MGKNNTNKVWETELSEIPHQIILSSKLKQIIDQIQEDVGNNEFTILVKGSWTQNGFILTDDYYIPEQEVTSSTVDYEENLRPLREDEKYNVLIHSHPFSTNGASYSSADETSANMHFECAMLLDGNNNLCQGKCMLKSSSGVLKMDMDIAIVEPQFDIEVDTENIEEKKTTTRYGNRKNYNGRTQQAYRQHMGMGYEKVVDGIYLTKEEVEQIEESTDQDIDDMDEDEIIEAYFSIAQQV